MGNVGEDVTGLAGPPTTSRLISTGRKSPVLCMTLSDALNIIVVAEKTCC